MHGAEAACLVQDGGDEEQEAAYHYKALNEVGIGVSQQTGGSGVDDCDYGCND